MIFDFPFPENWFEFGIILNIFFWYHLLSAHFWHKCYLQKLLHTTKKSLRTSLFSKSLFKKSQFRTELAKTIPDIKYTVSEFSKYFLFSTFLNLLRVLVLSVYRRITSQISKVQKIIFRYLEVFADFQRNSYTEIFNSERTKTGTT